MRGYGAPSTFASFAAGRGAARNERDDAQAYEARQMQMDESRRQLEGQSQLRSYVNSAGPDVSGEKIIKAGMGYGALDPIAGQNALASMAASRAKQKTQMTKDEHEKLKMAATQLEWLGKASMGVNEQNYPQFVDLVRTTLGEQQAAMLPPQWDEEQFKALQQSGMDAYQQATLLLGKERNDIARDRANKPPAKRAPVQAVNPETNQLEWTDPDAAVGRAPPPPKATGIKQKHQDLIDMGVPPEIATSLAINQIKVIPDKENGGAVIFDLSRNQPVGRVDGAGVFTPAPPPGSAPPAPVAPPVRPDGQKDYSNIWKRAPVR